MLDQLIHNIQYEYMFKSNISKTRDTIEKEIIEIVKK